MKRITLREFMNVAPVLVADSDISVDGIDSIAYCGETLTEEGEKIFKDALDKCYITSEYPDTIQWDNDETDDEEGIPECAHDAWEMFAAMAGFCPIDIHSKWFNGVE